MTSTPDQPLVVANWKMNTTLDEALALARGMTAVSGVEMVLCPPFPWLTEVARVIEGTGIALGAQNVHFEDRGGFTGEVSPLMLKGLCRYVLVGHSERRVHFRETEWAINRKVLAALKHGITPILCVGETAEQLEHGESGIVVADQIEGGLKDVPDGADIVIAWDPVWATMGMATPPSAQEVGEMCGFIREAVGREGVRVIYGGSITPRNAAELAALAEIDGVLVGSSSLMADAFVGIAWAFGSPSP